MYLTVYRRGFNCYTVASFMIMLGQFTRMVKAIKKNLEYFEYKKKEKAVRYYLEGNDVQQLEVAKV